MTTTTAKPPKVPAGDPIPDRHRPNAGLLLETFEITPYAGPRLVGSVFRTGSRASGRRVRVHGTGPAPALLFDSDDCYDLGNATHALDAWLDAYHYRLADVMPGVSPIFTIWDSKGLVYWGFNEFVPDAARCYRYVAKAHAEAVLSNLRMCHPLRQLDILRVERPVGATTAFTLPVDRVNRLLDAQPAGGSIPQDPPHGTGLHDAGSYATYQRAIDAGLLVRCDHCGEEVPQTPGGQAAGDSQQIIDGVFCEPCTKKLADRAELARLADDGGPNAEVDLGGEAG